MAGAGPLAVPLGVALGAALIGVRGGRATAGSALLPVELLLGCYLLLVAGATLVALLTSPGAALLTAAHLAISAFGIADGVLGGIAGLALLLLVRARSAGAERPRWPWEDRDDV